MPLVAELRERQASLWERVVGHPFTNELGDGTLPLEKFQRYFLQDYVFFRAFVTLISLGIAKAPSYAAARPLAGFLHEILQGEEGLFRGAFQEWGWQPSDYEEAEPTPAARALGDLMVRTSYEGTFAEVLTVLVVTELTYLEWATRQAGKKPGAQVYEDWIVIHSAPDFRTFVEGLVGELDSLSLSETERARVERLFEVTLRYELAFFEMGYRGEAWPA